MLRLIVRIKWWMFGEPACVTRKRIRQDLEEMCEEGAWMNIFVSARREK